VLRPHPSKEQGFKLLDMIALLVEEAMSMLCRVWKSATTHLFPAEMHAAVQEVPVAPRTHELIGDHDGGVERDYVEAMAAIARRPERNRAETVRTTP
jgi:hypothetical protein